MPAPLLLLFVLLEPFESFKTNNFFVFGLFWCKFWAVLLLDEGLVAETIAAAVGSRLFKYSFEFESSSLLMTDSFNGMVIGDGSRWDEDCDDDEVAEFDEFGGIEEVRAWIILLL